MPFRFPANEIEPSGDTRGDSIVVVSGLPRSGTSMMMKMLEVGGLEILTDHIRTADVSNPKGYYEFERVKKLKEGDTEWLVDARGKAVKVISALLEYLPSDYHYKIIFMKRNLEEILASQKKMLVTRGEPTDKVSDEKLAQLYRKHLNQVEVWLAQQANMEVIFTSYNESLADLDTHVAAINQFLGGNMNTAQMLEVVDESLYRQRRKR